MNKTVVLGFSGGVRSVAAVAWLQPDPANMLISIAAALLVPVLVGGLFSLVRSRF